MTPLDAPSTLRWPTTRAQRGHRSTRSTDPLEQMARDDRDDWVLLRLVVCATVAALSLAIVSSLSV